MNIDFGSVIKAGLVGAVVGAIVGIISGLPFIGIVAGICSCFGGWLIPTGTGLLYGYFAPGEETMGQAALGGALSGLAAGLMAGVVNVITTAVYTLIWGSGDIVEVFAATAFVTIGTVCGSIIGGGLFGALGGVIWTFIQGQRKA